MEAVGKDFINFWEYAAGKGLVKKDWASTLRSASKQVLASVEPDSWEALDLTELDVDSFIHRFERLRMADLKPDSLAVYGKRFRSALGGYKDFLESPSTWQFGGSRGDAGNGEKKKATRAPSEPRAASSSKTPGNESDARVLMNGSGVTVLAYPYPLRHDLIVTFHLPTDLSKHEAKRMAAYLDSLALDPQLALPAGPSVNGAA